MTKRNISESKRYPRDVLINWINDLNFTHAVTLTLNKRVHIHKARAHIGDLFFRLDKQLLGKKAYKLPSPKRSLFFAFPEHITSNIHYHLALRLAEDVMVPTCWMKMAGNAFLDQQWKKITRYSGDVKVKEISSNGWAHYITKDIELNDRLFTDAEFILSKEFHSDDTLEPIH